MDETGKVKVQDGSFKEAGFSGPGYMTVDPKDPNVLYVVDGNRYGGTSIRVLDLKKKEVSTLLTKGQGNWESIRTIDFTLSGDTMLITNQQDTENAIGISYTTRANGFKKPQPLVIGRKIVLYKEGKDDKKKIELPPANKKN